MAFSTPGGDMQSQALVQVFLNMEVFGISVITDECFPDALQPADINDIIRTANDAQPNLTLLMKRLIEKL